MTRGMETAIALVATLCVGALVAIDGTLPSAFTTLFFIPIILIAYRQPLAISALVALLAGLFSSPAMELAGVEIESPLLPVMWLGWPAVYLFLAVSLNQWASIQLQRGQLAQTELRLEEVGSRNLRRESELETLSAIHSTIMSGGDESAVLREITGRVADACGAKSGLLVMPAEEGGLQVIVPDERRAEMYKRFFPGGAPTGEGVAGWAMMHHRVAYTRNLFDDPRYEKLREFAALIGIVSSAAAPVELEDGGWGALVVSFDVEKDFTSEELTRLERLAHQTEIAIRSVRQRETLSRFAFETALALTEAIESRDPYTGGHCRRLAEYAGLVAERMHFPEKELEVVRLGAALHDMGKIVVPDSILKKPGKLTPEEYAIVKQHCYSGGQICKRVGFLMNAYPIVYHHHERWDGKGYPDGLKGDRIPKGARIVAVVDAYDAMTTDRPYREAMPLNEVWSILRDGAGRQWDARIVETFIETVHVHGDPELGLQPGSSVGRTGSELVLPGHQHN